MSINQSITHFTIKSTQGVFPASTYVLIFHQDGAPTQLIHLSETALHQVSNQQPHDTGYLMACFWVRVITYALKYILNSFELWTNMKLQIYVFHNFNHNIWLKFWSFLLFCFNIVWKMIQTYMTYETPHSSYMCSINVLQLLLVLEMCD